MPPRLGALLAIAVWGVSFVATKAVLQEASPVTVIFTRTTLGSALLVAVMLVRGDRRLPPRTAWEALLAMGFIGVFVHQLIQAYGLTLTSAVHTGWLVGLTPVWSAILSALVLRERFPPAKLAGIALGFAGAALVVTRGRLEAGLLALPSTRGDLLILASNINWAVYTVVATPTLRRLGAMPASAASLVVGWLMLAPLFVAVRGWEEYARLSPRAWAALAFLGLLCSGLGYLFWYGALAKVEASRVSSLLYLEPLVTLAAARVLLGEPIGWAAVMGGLLVLGGVLLVQRAPLSPPPPPRREGSPR